MKKLCKGKYNKKETAQCYLMIAPMLIGFTLFSLYPIFWFIRWCLYDYNGYKATFVGLDNFVRLFTRDPWYWNALGNTFLIAFFTILIQIPLALLLAVILNNKLRGSAFFRTVFFMPVIISIAIIGLVFSILFATHNGLVNMLLQTVGLIDKPINWLGSRFSAMVLVISASVWSSFGLYMIYFIMGLQNIPGELYECAQLDGANKVQQFFRITVPMLGNVLQIVTLLALVGVLKMVDLVLVLTNGDPAGGTEVVMTYIFKYFFNSAGTGSVQTGYGTALSLVTAVIFGIVSVIYLKVTSKKMS